ncbi:PD-(D/E)XK nuclease family protein [Chryseobacterium sp. 18068]|uniref:PD-(D/E)XK nuclease family protein n=1 Tax=Chryseobacterium sp. 18068 TaxID=2681414 RepID=UPI001359A3C9|nr:PD-(D/E)XK nuclease family protein [Chryseobacterium sp. 18068]
MLDFEIQDFFEKNNFEKIKIEDNFFNLGSRRFYENPFTEVLSYILDSETQFSGRKEFIEVLLKDCIPEEALNSLIGFGKVSTQTATLKGNVMDLIFYNHTNIVVFENKIFHSANNPFDDYVTDIKKRYLRHQHHFVLLSYKKKAPLENWYYISIQEKFRKFNKTYTYNFTNKWDYFIKDYILHFSNNNTFMNPQEKKFYEENFAKIILASNNLNNFLLDIANSFLVKANVKSFEIDAKWNSETKAIRFYPFDDKSNIVLIFNLDNTFSTSVYYYKDFTSFNDFIYDEVGKDAYKSWPEQKICCFTLNDGISFKSLSEALDECEKQTKIMRKIYIEKFAEIIDL